MATVNAKDSPLHDGLPLVSIVGPTASGKTSVAIELAKKHRGEVVCADSRTIYRGMDIGTAKPTVAERSTVPHWGLDLVDPGQRYTAAMFQDYARKCIDDIRARGKLPILVGGTGLYIDSLLFSYVFPDQPSGAFRQRVEGMSLEQLQIYCNKNNIKIPKDLKNKRHILTAIFSEGTSQKRNMSILDNTIVVGIAANKLKLNSRIAQRTEHIFKSGVVKEATILGEKYGWNNEAMTGNIYPVIRRLTSGEITLKQAKEQFSASDRQLAKRQMTWFRRNGYIQWCLRGEAVEYIEERLAFEHKLW